MIIQAKIKYYKIIKYNLNNIDKFQTTYYGLYIINIDVKIKTLLKRGYHWSHIFLEDTEKGNNSLWFT
jgi:hypothetical protein